MKKTVFICGLMAGLISTSLYIALMLIGRAGDIDFENGMLYGYTLMIAGFSLIFVATKITRDKYSNGIISFGKAFRVGLYITLIASTVYVVVWLIDNYIFIPDFAEKYSAYILKKLRASGASAISRVRAAVPARAISRASAAALSMPAGVKSSVAAKPQDPCASTRIPMPCDSALETWPVLPFLVEISRSRESIARTSA